MSAPHGRQALPDGVTRYAATSHDLHSYERASQDIERMRVPRLLDAARPDSRLFLAYFDGTGNDATRQGEQTTNVAKLHHATVRALTTHPGIATGYVKGPGTQRNEAVALRDGITGGSYDDRLDTMYMEFCRQASRWLKENPDAQISLASIGFSRGAEQAAGFARLVAERGIRDPDHMPSRRNREGLVTQLDWAHAPVMNSGRDIAQAQVLIDPVGTGIPHQRDRRPPGQVLSALQITAEDDTRDQFQGSRIWDLGFTQGGRGLNVLVGGTHSGVGGGYVEDGLARRSFNLAADYLNALTDRPFIAKRYLRPDLDVVQRSVEHQRIYDEDVFNANVRAGRPDGQRRGHFEVIGGNMQDRSAAARDAQPIDAALDARFERHPVRIGPVPETPTQFRDLPAARERTDLQPHPPRQGAIDWLLDRVVQAEQTNDRTLARAAFSDYAASPYGQALAAQVERFDALQRETMHALAAAETPAQRSHAMRL